MKMSERAINAPQGLNARRLEATIMDKMPADTWLTVTQTSRLIRVQEDRIPSTRRKFGVLHVHKQKKTPRELSDTIRAQIGASKALIIDVHPDKQRGWHVTVYGYEPNIVARAQSLAEAAADFLRTEFNLGA
jgi:hypothetical protein